MSVGIVFIQLILVIVYHAYKYMNQKLFATIRESVICMKIENFLSKEQKRRNHEDTHQFDVLLDFIDHTTNTNDYNLSQIQPRSTEPTQSVVELSNSQPTSVKPPPLEAKEEEPELESTVQQATQQGDVNVILVEENLSAEIYENKQCINNYSEIEIAECNESQNVEINSTTLKEISIPKSDSDAKISYCAMTEQANREAMEIPQSDNVDQSMQEVPVFPANGDQQEGVGS